MPQNAAATQEAIERRDAPRANVDGRYTMRMNPGDGRSLITCMLLDFSVTGARLELPEDVALPDKLQIVIGNLSHNVRIAWRKGTTVGIDFVDEHHSIF